MGRNAGHHLFNVKLAQEIGIVRHNLRNSRPLGIVGQPPAEAIRAIVVRNGDPSALGEHDDSEEDEAVGKRGVQELRTY